MLGGHSQGENTFCSCPHIPPAPAPGSHLEAAAATVEASPSGPRPQRPSSWTLSPPPAAASPPSRELRAASPIGSSLGYCPPPGALCCRESENWVQGPAQLSRHQCQMSAGGWAAPSPISLPGPPASEAALPLSAAASRGNLSQNRPPEPLPDSRLTETMR